MPRLPPIDPVLLSLTPSEALPLWLELARAQAGRRTPRDLAQQLERDGFVQPSRVDLRLSHRLDGLALDAAADFEAVLLSPAAPLGSCTVVAPTSQHRVISAARGTEIVADPTNMLALLSAQRLKAGADVVRLCTTHQVTRAQPLPDFPGASRHFRMFAMSEAGAARPDNGFDVDAMCRQLSVMDRLFDAAGTLGVALPQRQVRILATPERQHTAAILVERLRAALPHAEVVIDGAPHGYYDGLRALSGPHLDGRWLPVGDCGVFNWVAQLTSNARHRFVASGVGIQLLALRVAG